MPTIIETTKSSVQKITVGDKVFPPKKWRSAIMAYLDLTRPIGKKAEVPEEIKRTPLRFDDRSLWLQSNGHGWQNYHLEHPINTNSYVPPLPADRKQIYLCRNSSRAEVDRGLLKLLNSPKTMLAVFRMTHNNAVMYISKLPDGTISVHSSLTAVM